MKPYGVANNHPGLPDWLSLWAREHETGLQSVVETVVYCEQVGSPREEPSVAGTLDICGSQYRYGVMCHKPCMNLELNISELNLALDKYSIFKILI